MKHAKLLLQQELRSSVTIRDASNNKKGNLKMKTLDEILKELADGRMNVEEAAAAMTRPKLKFRVNEERGTVSAIGLRQPFVLYADQWRLILEQADELRKFLDDNAHLTKEFDTTIDRFKRSQERSKATARKPKEPS